MKGMTITAEECDVILSRALAMFEQAVLKAVTAPFNQNQFDALVSLAFNIGAGNFSKSTLVKNLNDRDYRGAADQFTVWNKAGGRVLKGLETRRYSERAQFLKADSRLIERITAPELASVTSDRSKAPSKEPKAPSRVLDAPQTPAVIVGDEPSRNDGTFTTPPGPLARFWNAFKKRIAA